MAPRLRIAYLLSSLQTGGSERQMLMLAERLPKQDFEVDFMVMSGPGEHDDIARAAGTEVVSLGRRPDPGETVAGRLQRQLDLARNLLTTVRYRRYDIIDAWLYPADLIAGYLRPLMHSPLVVSGRRNLSDHSRFGPASEMLDIGMRHLVAAVVANSRAAAEYALLHHHVDPEKLHVIYNGVLPAPNLDAATRTRLRQEFGVDDQQTLIACVANYRDVKRHDHLVEAYSRITSRCQGAKLVLIGSGPQQRYIERHIEARGLRHRIRVHGPVADARAHYGAFDIVVQASDSEGLPNALLEAASAGRPVVATAAGGSAEVVIDGETGILVPVGDVEALAFGMLRLVQDRALRHRLGRAAQARSLATFSVESMVSAFARLYHDVAAGRRVSHHS